MGCGGQTGATGDPEPEHFPRAGDPHDCTQLVAVGHPHPPPVAEVPHGNVPHFCHHVHQSPIQGGAAVFYVDFHLSTASVATGQNRSFDPDLAHSVEFGVTGHRVVEGVDRGAAVGDEVEVEPSSPSDLIAHGLRATEEIDGEERVPYDCVSDPLSSVNCGGIGYESTSQWQYIFV